MIPSFLADTSLQDPGIYLEAWFVLALFVILNCGSALEAGKKCFVFFLISQPLIYLVQVPFAFLGWGILSLIIPLADIWVFPYFETSCAIFYESVSGNTQYYQSC